MLRALGSPVDLVVLLLSFLLAVTLHGWLQGLLAGRAGDRSVAAEGRTRLDPRRQLDPFGTVAAVIAGVGWSRQVTVTDRRDRAALVRVLLVPPLVLVGLGLACLVGYRAAGGPPTGVSVVLLQLGAGGGLDLAPRVLLLLGLTLLFTGVLALVPLPPLPGAGLLFGLGPTSQGWRKAEHQLVERGIGVVALLVLLLLPLGGPQALLPLVLDALVAPLAELLTRA